MTDRLANVVYATAGIAGAAIWLAVSDLQIDLTDRGFLWFELLIWLVVAAFLIEPRFTSGPVVVTNGVAAVFVSLSTGFEVLPAWWALVTVVAASAIVLSSVSYASQDRVRPSEWTTEMRSVARALGSWRSLIVGSLVLALVSFNEPFDTSYQISALVVVYVLGAQALEPHRFLLPRPERDGDLRLLAIGGPCEALIGGQGIEGLARGVRVEVSGSGGRREGLVVGRVAYRSERAWRAVVPGLVSILPAAGSATPTSCEVRQIEAGQPDGALAGMAERLQSGDAAEVGLVGRGSRIEGVRIELLPDETVEQGEVVWVHDSHLEPLYFQVAEATVETTSWVGDTRHGVFADARQIGRWDPEIVGFEPSLRSPSPGSLAVRGSIFVPAVPTSSDLFGVGNLPGTPFPVMVSVKELSRHHFAVLGTTGTGKTHLVFSVVNALADAGIKVVTVDPTNQYAARFKPDGHPSISWASLDDFLAGDATIGIYDPADDTDGITEANRLARKLYEWGKQQGPVEIGEGSRCVVVFEEAQNFVPETFVVNDWDLKAKAQDTSLVVMESRKFGLGFGLVSQRTAMVTKSALSQCNTVFAFQAVDQTGLDYLEGLCGSVLTKGIPTLAHRTMVAMGRGVTSRAPLIAHVADAPVVIA